MTDANPYSAPSLAEGEPSVVLAMPSTRRLWIAFGIAPLAAPLAAATTLFIVAFAYQSTHPEDTAINPMSMILVPVFLLLAGVPASYGIAGMVGMPLAFWLRKHGKLNAGTIHGAALLCTVVVASGAMTAAMIGQIAGFFALLACGLVLCLALAPCLLLTATVFWLIGVRRWTRLAISDAASHQGSSAGSLGRNRLLS